MDRNVDMIGGIKPGAGGVLGKATKSWIDDPLDVYTYILNKTD